MARAGRTALVIFILLFVAQACSFPRAHAREGDANMERQAHARSFSPRAGRSDEGRRRWPETSRLKLWRSDSRQRPLTLVRFAHSTSPRTRGEVRRKKGSGTPTDAYPTVRILRMRQRAHRSTLACRRSTAALAGDVGTSPSSFRPGFLGRGRYIYSARWALPTPACPSPVRTAQPVIVPATDAQSRPGEVCETARRHRTRSACRIASGYVPDVSEIRENVTEMVTNVNGKEIKKRWPEGGRLAVNQSVIFAYPIRSHR